MHSPASTSQLSSSPSIHTPTASTLSLPSTPARSDEDDDRRRVDRDELASNPSRSSSYDQLQSDDDHTTSAVPTPRGRIKRQRKAATSTRDGFSTTSGAVLPPISSHYDPASLTIGQCLWNDCGQEFYELEPFIDHLHNLHAFPDGKPPPAARKGAPIYTCEWTGCPRRGKNQNSKFALIGHLRSHTGEKPFICPRPECDKSFTRTDALQKHMRIQHGDNILPSRKPPTKKRKGTAAGARAGSVESESAAATTVIGTGMDDVNGPGGGPNDDETSTVAGGDDGDEAAGGGGQEPEWSEGELEAFDNHPEFGHGFVAYVLLKAKWRAALQDYEALAGELEAVGTREAELGAECNALLRRVLSQEVGLGPGGPSDVERFMSAYAQDPSPMPIGWTGDFGKGVLP